MSGIIVGVSVVLNSHFPRMAYRIFRCMVVYIPVAVFSVYRATKRSLRGFTEDRTITSDMCREYDCNETIVWKVIEMWTFNLNIRKVLLKHSVDLYETQTSLFRCTKVKALNAWI